ncbi:GIY-YIG nuclease family protein [Streptomyces venezuelae]|uniref:GIY-YIG nuclease family protein n=1 Tax=Streptomyces sp. B6(2022) TaxID=3404749 RepID=UPI00311EA700
MEKVDPQDPDRTAILIMVHRFELAGIDIDDRAVEIAAQYMRWERTRREEESARQHAEWEKRQAETEVRESWVYFIRIGQLVKIGMTTNLANRFSSLRPNEVLVIQPGGLNEETALHKRFAALRAGGEFFHPGPSLQEHIRELRERVGAPNWKKSLVPDGCNWFEG